MRKEIEIKIGKKALEASLAINLATTLSKALQDAGLIAGRPNASLGYILKEMDAFCDKEKARIQQYLGPHIREYQTLVEQFDIEDLRDATNREVSLLEKKKEPLLIDLSRIHLDYDWRWERFWQGMLVGSIAGDVITNYHIFQAFGISLLESIVVAAISVGVVALGSHFLGEYIRESSTAWQRKMRLLISLGCGLVFFSVLSLIRAMYHREMGNEVDSYFVFTLFNLCIFMVAVAISAFKLPNKRQKAEKLERDQIAGKVEEISQKQEALQQHFESKNALYKLHASDLEDISKFERETINLLPKEYELLKRKVESEFYIKGGTPPVAEEHIV